MINKNTLFISSIIILNFSFSLFALLSVLVNEFEGNRYLFLIPLVQLLIGLLMFIISFKTNDFVNWVKSGIQK